MSVCRNEDLPIYLDLVSGWPPDVIDAEKEKLAAGQNPMDVKKRLANRLVEIYHGPDAAVEAEAHFRRVVQDRSAPEETPVVAVQADFLGGEPTWVEVLAHLGLMKSRGEARRLIAQGGFYLEQKPVT